MQPSIMAPMALLTKRAALAVDHSGVSSVVWGDTCNCSGDCYGVVGDIELCAGAGSQEAACFGTHGTVRGG